MVRAAVAAGGFSGFAEGSTGAKADACLTRKVSLLAGEGIVMRAAGSGGKSALAAGKDALTGSVLSAEDAVVTAADFHAADIAAAVAILTGRS